MRPLFRPLTRAVAAALALAIGSFAHAESILKENDVVAICGDSITEQKQYSAFIEAYLRMCQPTKVDVMQFGWSGETSWGFVKRMDQDVLIFKPTLATLCYGMNDGGYRATDPNLINQYRTAMTEIVDRFQKSGARVIVGTPGAVDTTTYKRPNGDAAVYNATLFDFGQVGKEIAEKSGSAFADVHTPMVQVMGLAKADLGPAYHVGGGDGVHPGANGHFLMAHAFLKAMKLDGEIGRIEVDLAKGTAEAKGRHKVTGSALLGNSNEIVIESAAYPFCFGGDPAKPNATSGIVKYTDFNQTLNRFILVVTGDAPKYRITWGPTSKEYTADQLKAGVNLAADFIQNPFSEPFNVVERAIREKQVFETRAFKGLIHSLGETRELLKADEAVDALIVAIRKTHGELNAKVVDAVKPVTHTIKIEAVR